MPHLALLRRLRRRAVVLATFATLLLAGCEAPRPPAGLVVSWEAVRPERVGLDGTRLDELKDSLAGKRTTAFLIVRHNQIAYEWYAGRRHGPGRRLGTASLAKSLVAGMALLVALNDGRLRLDERAAAYIPNWMDDPGKSKITIRQLATHTSGLQHGGRRRATWEKAMWDRSPDLFPRVLDGVALRFDPGEQLLYSMAGYVALSYAITAALQGAPEADIETLLRRRIMDPIEVPRSAWNIGYGTSFRVDSMTVYPTWSGAAYTARAAARVGQLMLQAGRWGDRQLVDSVWVERMVSHDASTPPPRPHHGPAHPAAAVCWWSNALGAWPLAPRDAFAGVGAGGQLLLVIPSLDLVVVRFGEAPGEHHWGPEFWAELESEFVRPLMEVVLGSRPRS